MLEKPRSLGSSEKIANPSIAFGDSITNPGTGASVPANAYINKLATQLGVSINNQAVSGSMSADQSWLMYGVTPSTSVDTMVMLGTNDAQVYGSDATKRQASINFLRNIAVWNLCPSRVNARSMTLTGSGWVNTPVNSIGLESKADGDTATATVSGTAVYVSYLLHNLAQSQGNFDILIDGTLVKNVQLNGVYVGNTQLGRSYAGACIRLAGLSAGQHTVKIVSHGSLSVHLEYIAGSSQAVHPKVTIADVIRRNATGYGSSGNSDANIAAYNADYATMISELASDGHQIFAAHLPSFNPSTELSSDGIHPNDAGHASLASDWATALGTVHTFVSVSTYRRDDGLYFIDDGAKQRQIQVL